MCLNLPTKHPLKFRIVDGGSYYILKAWTRMMLLCVRDPSSKTGKRNVKKIRDLIFF